MKLGEQHRGQHAQEIYLAKPSIGEEDRLKKPQNLAALTTGNVAKDRRRG